MRISVLFMKILFDDTFLKCIISSFEEVTNDLNRQKKQHSKLIIESEFFDFFLWNLKEPMQKTKLLSSWC